MSKNSIDSKHDSSDLSMNLLNRNNSTASTTTTTTSAPDTPTTTTISSTTTTTTNLQPTTTNTNTTTTKSSDSSLNNPNSNDMVNKTPDHMLQQQSNSKKSSITESTSFLNVNNIKAHSENYCFLKAKKLERKYLKNSGNNNSNSNSNKNAISDNSLHPSDKYLNLYLDEKQQQLETGGAAGGSSASGTTTTNPSKNVIKSYPLFRSKDPPKTSDASKFNYSFNSIGKRSRSSAASASSSSCTFCRQDSIESHNGGTGTGYGSSIAAVAEYNRQHSAPTDTRPLSLTSSTSTTTACTTNNTPGILNYNNCYNSTTTTTAPATATPTTSTTRLNSLKPASCLCFHTNSLKRKRLPSSTNRLSGGGGRYTLNLIFKF